MASKNEQQIEEELVTKGAAAQFGNANASILNALESRFSELAGTRSNYIASLPQSIRNRIDALKNLAKKNKEIERNFQREVEALERKYLSQHKPLFEKRQEIVVGSYEPTVEEIERSQEEKEDDGELPIAPAEPESPSKGIPEFWLTCLKNLPPFQETITDEDEGALKHLIDIRYSYLEGNPGFVLEFEFEENEYFTNTVLTKAYYLEDSPERQDLVFDHTEGCTIDWKEGKDLSVRIEVKKQRHKATNKTRTVKKTVPAETFFNFFKALKMPEPGEEVDDEILEAFEIDYETGELIKDKLVPDAVNWFTGQALEEFDEGEYSDEDDEDEFDDDEDEDEDDEDQPPTDKAPECKQQ